MAARQAKGLNVSRQFKPKDGVAALLDGTPYLPGMRVRLEGTDELGSIAWCIRDKTEDRWQAIVSWDCRDEVKGGKAVQARTLTPPSARQYLNRLVAA